MLERYRTLHLSRTFPIDDYAEFKERIEGGGFFSAGWCGKGECEAKVKEETKATIRCIPLDAPDEAGTCLRCDGASPRRVLFARAY